MITIHIIIINESIMGIFFSRCLGRSATRFKRGLWSWPPLLLGAPLTRRETLTSLGSHFQTFQALLWLFGKGEQGGEAKLGEGSNCCTTPTCDASNCQEERVQSLVCRTPQGQCWSWWRRGGGGVGGWWLWGLDTPPPSAPSAQCVHCTVGFPCSKKSPVVATGECSCYRGITIANGE